MKTTVTSCSSAILREEVKYVHTDADLLAMEKAARGKKDIVLGYVRSLGTQGKHGGKMEAGKVLVCAVFIPPDVWWTHLTG